MPCMPSLASSTSSAHLIVLLLSCLLYFLDSLPFSSYICLRSGFTSSLAPGYRHGLHAPSPHTCYPPPGSCRLPTALTLFCGSRPAATFFFCTQPFLILQRGTRNGLGGTAALALPRSTSAHTSPFLRVSCGIPAPVSRGSPSRDICVARLQRNIGIALSQRWAYPARLHQP